MNEGHNLSAERQGSGLGRYWALFVLLFFVWLLFASITVIYIKMAGDLNPVTFTFSVLLPAAFPGSVIWVLYTFYVAYKHLPEVDHCVDPEGAKRYLSYDVLSRMHRLVYYYAAMTNERFNTKAYPDFDFTSLPRTLQLPFKIYGHWMVLMGVAGVVAYIAMKWAEAAGALPV